MRYISPLLFLLFYIPWVGLCFVVSLLGWCLPRNPKAIDLEKVLERETICRVLHEKGKLSKKEYEFETQDVAGSYDELTIKGYLLIVSPVIPVLKSFKFLDGLIMWLVSRWMKAHHYFLGRSREKNSMENLITLFCVWNAKNVGRFLILLRL